MAVECSLLPRRPCRFGGARRPRAWCRRRPAALAAPRRAASVTSRALRGVFWHVSAWHRRQEARLPCLRPRACGRARQARRRSARVFELAARDEPAWLVARREPAQHALGTLYSLDKVSGKADRASAGCLGRDGALDATMTTISPIGSPAAGLRGALLDGRLLSNLSTVSFTSLLSLQPPAGAGAGRLASPALPTPTTRASARRPRRLRRARGARRSSGACSAGCAAQPDSLRAPLMRRGAAGGAAAAHAALWASPSCPRRVADATCGSRLPCPSLPSRKQTHTHARTHTHY